MSGIGTPWRLGWIGALLLLAMSGSAVAASPRLALVMGNSTYGEQDDWAPLPNVRNDVREMRKVLKELGFRVLPENERQSIDLDRTAMEDAVLAMKDALAAGDGREVALVYYSGHGVKIGKGNFLIPVKARIDREEKANSLAYSAETILGEIGTAPGRLNLLLIDACRADPFVKGRSPRWKGADSEGFSAFGQRAGTVIGYATEPGTLASAGLTGQTLSPYTAALLPALRTPGLTLQKILSSAETTVTRLTDGQQVPHMEARASMLDWVARPALPAPQQSAPSLPPPDERPRGVETAQPPRMPEPTFPPLPIPASIPASVPASTGTGRAIAALPSLADFLASVKEPGNSLPYPAIALSPQKSPNQRMASNGPYRLYDEHPISSTMLKVYFKTGMALNSYIPTISSSSNDDPHYERYLSNWPSDIYSHNFMLPNDVINYFKSISHYLLENGDPLTTVTRCCSGFKMSYHYGEDGGKYVFVTSEKKYGSVFFLIEISEDMSLRKAVNLGAFQNILRSYNEDVSVSGAYSGNGHMYFCVVNESFAKKDKVNSSFIVDLDLEKNKINWISEPKVCNENITMYGDSIVSSYGGSYHKDYVYVTNRVTGVTTTRIPLQTAADFLVNVDGEIQGARYYNVPFIIKQAKP